MFKFAWPSMGQKHIRQIKTCLNFTDEINKTNNIFHIVDRFRVNIYCSNGKKYSIYKMKWMEQK